MKRSDSLLGTLVTAFLFIVAVAAMAFGGIFGIAGVFTLLLTVIVSLSVNSALSKHQSASAVPSRHATITTMPQPAAPPSSMAA